MNTSSTEEGKGFVHHHCQKSKHKFMKSGNEVWRNYAINFLSFWQEIELYIEVENQLWTYIPFSFSCTIIYLSKLTTTWLIWERVQEIKYFPSSLVEYYSIRTILSKKSYFVTSNTRFSARVAARVIF